MTVIKNIRTICFSLGLGILVSCGGGNSDGNSVVNLPAKPNLSLPANGENCSIYTIVASDNTKAEINFSWAGATYATSYILVVTQAGAEVFKKEISTTSYKVVLDKGKTYSWTVTAKNGDGVNPSTTNSFTTPGNPIGNYVPYAAVIYFSVNSSSSMASLSWVGKDEDSMTTDLKYDIEIKKDNIVIQSLTDQTITSITDFAAVLNATYQIKINTIDKQGSYSTSIVTYTYN